MGEPDGRRVGWGAAAGAVAVLTVLQAVRSTGSLPLEVVYSDDGPIFLTGALNDGAGALAEPYAGYVHLVPRLLASGVALLPVEHAALGLALAASAVVSLLAVYVFRAAAPVVPSPWIRAFLTGAFALTPAAGWEISANLANLQWFALYAAFWALLTPWRGRGQALTAAAVAALTALSSPLAALFAPLALLTARRARRGAGLIAPAALGAGLLVQLLLREEGPRALGELGPAEVPVLFAERVAGVFLAGERIGGAVVRAVPAAAWLALGALLATWALVLWRARGRRAEIAACVAYSAAFFAVVMLVRRPSDFSAADGLNGGRYVYVPVMFALTALFIGLARERLRLAPHLAGAIVLALVAGQLIVPNVRAGGPEWAPLVERARAACADEGSRTVEVAVWTPAPGWNAVVPCARLRL